MRDRLGRITLVCALLSAAAVGGCYRFFRLGGQAAPTQALPEPVKLLLPKKIRIHSFTGTRDFSDAGGIRGIDVRIEAIDAYGDATKAFGKFRFELFGHQRNSADPKGPRIAAWTVNVEEPKVNRRHWKSIWKTYQFKLGWREPIPIGRKFVLTAVFESPYSARVFDERVFVSGQ